MSIPEVQSFLGIKSRKTILRYIAAGKLIGCKIGGTRWRIPVSAVTDFLKAEFGAADVAVPDTDAPSFSHTSSKSSEGGAA